MALLLLPCAGTPVLSQPYRQWKAGGVVVPESQGEGGGRRIYQPQMMRWGSGVGHLLAFRRGQKEGGISCTFPLKLDSIVSFPPYVLLCAPDLHRNLFEKCA